MTAFFLVVRDGADAGARASVPDGGALVIGRASGSGLALRDPAVSRRHLEARAEAGQLVVRAEGTAAPFVVKGETVREARLTPGDTLLVGDTRIHVEAGEARDGLDGAATQRTDVRTLFDGASAEVRGLSALFQLTEALDRAADRAAAEHALSAFLKEHASASEVTVGHGATGESAIHEDDSATGGAPTAIVEHTAAGVTTLVLSAGTASPAAITVRLAPGAPLSNPLRRLLLVAARLFVSRTSQLRALTSAREETASLRALAVGSARAFLGTSKAAEQVARVVPRLAASDAAALLLGESGVGKTFVARLIHEASPRLAEPLRVINCAAIPENLLEAELFGVERGAFTGAVAARPGAFEAAGAGTLFLDEIGELGLTSQAKLLRALEERRFERLGGNRTLPLRARVLAATNRDLAAMVEAGTFRRDLYFRISVITLRIPSLRERGDDIRLLSEQILADLAPSAARRVRGFSPAALAAIQAYAWPGNVRELRNAIEHALVLGDGPLIEPADFPEIVSTATSPAPLPTRRSCACRCASTSWRSSPSAPRSSRHAETAPAPRRCWASIGSRSTRSCARSRRAEAPGGSAARRTPPRRCGARAAGLLPPRGHFEYR